MVFSNNERRRIIKNYLQNNNPRSIAALFKSPLSTIKSIIKVYNEEGKIELNQRSGIKKQSLTANQKV